MLHSAQRTSWPVGWIGSCAPAVLLWVAMAGAVPAQVALPQATNDVDDETAPVGRSGKANSWQPPSISKQTVGRPSRSSSDGADAPTSRPTRLASRPASPADNAPADLPTDAGQFMRTYNIRPYTVRVTSTNHPEEAIRDWILRETGYEAWFSEPFGFMSANSHTLTVYHTPEMHKLVAEIVDRFVNTEAETNAFGLRVITVGHPNWRARAQPMLHAVPTQTQGIQAWLVHKEDAAVLLADLRKRMDFREHSSPHLLVNNGQSTTVSALRARTYVRDILKRPERWPAFEPEMSQFDEGFTLELNPLLSLDGRTVDAVIRCNIDQLERLVPVMLDVANPVNPRQRTKIEVPQITHCGLHEKFRWPTDQVLIVGLGVVPTPVPGKATGLLEMIPGLSSPPRADLLVFIESRGKVGTSPESGLKESKRYRNRY